VKGHPLESYRSEPFSPRVVFGQALENIAHQRGGGMAHGISDGTIACPASPGTINLAEWLMSPDGLCPLLAYPGVPSLSHTPAIKQLSSPVLAIQFCKWQVPLRLFTTIATLGTPQDGTMQGLCI
jgi:hypothetical protein